LDPLVVWLTAALAALGSFTAWLVKTWVPNSVYVQTLKDRDDWKEVALKALGNTERVATAAEKVATMTPEEAAQLLRVLGPEAAEKAWRVVVGARANGGSDG
jgi:hypothetical protein